MKRTGLLYGRGRVGFSVPDSWQVLEPVDPPAISDLDSAIAAALRDPVGSAGLLDLARSANHGGRAVVVISDITRAVPNRDFLPPILGVLEQAGYSAGRIVILVATGMHRPSTDAERLELVGPHVLGRYEIVDHRADEPGTLVELPKRTGSGTAARVDRTYAEAEFRLATGFIEPHFMVGFSGGRKAICPGLADLATVQKFHGPRFLGDPRAATGVLAGNPCHEESLDVARQVRPDFLFNVTIDGQGRITGIFAGDLEQAHEAGVRFVREHMRVQVARPFDAVFVSGGGYPLDTTFYQVVKGMEAAGQLIGPGGRVVVAGRCADGIGSAEYKNLMFEYADDYKRFLADIFSRDEVLKDQWEFQMQTRVLDKTGREGLIMVTDGIPAEDLRRCHVTVAQDMVGDEEVSQVLARLVNRMSQQTSRVAVLPRGPYLLPEVVEK